MKLLVTGAAGKLASRLLPLLSVDHTVRTVAEVPVLTSSSHLVGDLRDREFAAETIAGCDAVLHLEPVSLSFRPGDAPATEQLDRASRGTYNLLLAAINAGVQRFVLASTLRLLERYPEEWWVVESWPPRPTTDVDDLAPYLAELTGREVARVSPLRVICLRLGEVVDDAEIADRPFDSRWVHLVDTAQAVERALGLPAPTAWPPNGYNVYHITAPGPRSRFRLAAAGREPLGYAPTHDFAAPSPLPLSRAAGAGPRSPLPQRGTGLRNGARLRNGGEGHQPPQKVVIYGAGGPLAAAVAQNLARDRILRLTDVRPLAEVVAAGKPQSLGAPLPTTFDAPHEVRVVDVTDPEQVSDAATGMDAVVNCTVVRPDPIQAFRVNVLGAYNVMRAAVQHGIGRVVHTGPQQVTAGAPDPYSYAHDFRIVDDVPARPGASLYILTKFLGQEICRIFAEEHGLTVPALLFSSFVNPSNPPPEPLGAYPFSVSWEDSAEAVRLALDVAALPAPFEVFNISTDLPHGKVLNDKAKRLLGWQPRDRLERHWLRPDR